MNKAARDKATAPDKNRPFGAFIIRCRIRPRRAAAPGRCERLPAHTPLRTVRESFPSHGSSLAKDTPRRGFPRLDGKGGIMRTHSNRIGQLGNTGLRPFTLRSIGRQLRDAPSDWHRSSFAFPGLRRFHKLSCHSRPDRRGHIRHATHRRWLLRSSQCCACCPALRCE